MKKKHLRIKRKYAEILMMVSFWEVRLYMIFVLFVLTLLRFYGVHILIFIFEGAKSWSNKANIWMAILSGVLGFKV